MACSDITFTAYVANHGPLPPEQVYVCMCARNDSIVMDGWIYYLSLHIINVCLCARLCNDFHYCQPDDTMHMRVYHTCVSHVCIILLFFGQE